MTHLFYPNPLKYQISSHFSYNKLQYDCGPVINQNGKSKDFVRPAVYCICTPGMLQVLKKIERDNGVHAVYWLKRYESANREGQ